MGRQLGPYNAACSLGNTYDDTRSNEFGYADYELLLKPPAFIPRGRGGVGAAGATGSGGLTSH
jgi:hypothetical protein